MLLRIVHKELLDHLLSLRFLVASLLTLAAVLVSFGLSATRYQQASAEYDSNRIAHEREVLEGRSLGAWSGLAWRGIRVDKPLNPMALFARPPDAGFLLVASVNAYWEPEFVAQPNLADRLFGVLELAYFVTAVLSLLAILFSYDALCGEKQRGTLRLIMSYPVPRGTLMVGKWMGGYLSLLCPYLVALLGGCLLLTLGFGITLDAISWVCLGLIVAVSFLYLGAVFSLGIWLSACFERPVTAVVVLLMIWAGMVVLVPSLSPYLAEQLVPVQTVGELEAAKRIAKRELDEESRAERAKHPAESFDHWVMYAVLMDEMRGDQIVEQVGREERINERFRNEMRQQVGWAKGLSRASPASSFQFAVSSLAANGPEEALRFWQSLVDYRKVITKYAFYSWAEAGRDFVERQKAGLERGDGFDIQNYPRFSYRYPDAASRFSEALVDIVLLCFWNALLFFAGYLTFLKYDVR